MKVVFLDIDGVLQPYDADNWFALLDKKMINNLSKKFNVDYSKYGINSVSSVYYDWDEQAVLRLKYILDETGSKIIMSSDLRSNDNVYKLRDLLKMHYLGDYWYSDNAILKVGNNPVERRALEIKDYLNKYSIDNYVVLDDMWEIKNYFPNNTVITYNSISIDNMNECIKILKRKK